jgi:hypothetical protein
MEFNDEFSFDVQQDCMHRPFNADLWDWCEMLCMGSEI